VIPIIYQEILRKSLIRNKKFFQYLICGIKVSISLGLTVLALLGAFFVFPARQTYHIRESFVFSATQEDSRVFLGVLVPQNGPYQSVSNVTIQWPGDYQTKVYDSVDSIHFFGDIPPREQITATIEYDVVLQQSKLTWEAPVEVFQTQPQEGIESQHPVIQEKAMDFGSQGLANKAYRIYSFTSDYLSYAEVMEDCVSSSALKSYEIGSCVCAGYSRLMVALSRATGIPAQMVLGFVYPDPIVKRDLSNNLEHPGKPHAWVELNTFGRWSIADPTLGSGIWKRFFFGRTDGRHIRYGELEQLSGINQDQKMWALDHAPYTLGDFECFRYKSTSTSQDISMVPVTTVKKVWDGRWINTMVIWVIATFMLCKWRKYLLP